MKLARTPFPLAALLLATGCKLLPIDEARALRDRQQGHFDAKHYVASIWPGRVRDEFFGRAVALADLRSGPIDAIGRSKGHRAGEGSPWTFVVRGRGTVRAVDRNSPIGRIELDTPQGRVTLQTGPVFAGTTIRDAVPSIAFDDFPDQIAFAETGMELTARATAPLRPALTGVKPGETIGFLGAANVTGANDAIIVTPVEITR